MILYFNFDSNGNYKLETETRYALHLFEEHAQEFYDSNFDNNIMYSWIKEQLRLIKEKYPSAIIKLELIKTKINSYHMFTINIVNQTELALALLRI